jgi:hypothetical protein
VVHLQLHPALPESPCANNYFPLWSRLFSISSFQLLIHFSCTFVEFDAKFLGQILLNILMFIFMTHSTNTPLFTSWLLGTQWMDRVSLCFLVWATLQASIQSHNFCDRPHALWYLMFQAPFA